MIFQIYSDTSYLSEPRARSPTGGGYYLNSLPTDPKKFPNLPPPANGPIHTECRILKHVVASAAEAEFRGLFHNGQTLVPLIITLHELGFTQPPTPIKTDNSAAEGIVTATVRQKSSKAMDMQFYWMKDRVKQKDSFVHWKPGSQNMGDYFTKHHPIIPHVLASWFPINEKVFLFYPVLHPIKLHVHCLGPFLSNCSGDDAFGCGVVCFYWGWWLGKTEFMECNS